MSEQVAEIQNEGPPAVPQPSGNALKDSAARAEHFRQTVAWFEKNPGKGYTDHAALTTAPPEQPTVNAEDAELVKATHADAVKRFGAKNSAVNALIERMHVDLQSGKRIDRDAYAAQFAEAVATPESRAEQAALDELAKVMDPDGGVRADQIPKRILGDYVLPTDRLYDAESTAAGLALARKMQLTQQQLDAYLASQGDQ